MDEIKNRLNNLEKRIAEQEVYWKLINPKDEIIFRTQTIDALESLKKDIEKNEEEHIKFRKLEVSHKQLKYKVGLLVSLVSGAVYFLINEVVPLIVGLIE